MIMSILGENFYTNATIWFIFFITFRTKKDSKTYFLKKDFTVRIIENY